MIAFLTGTLYQKDHDHVIVLTHGVGYQVYLSRQVLENLGPVGSPVELHIHAVIREDSHQLFGFKSLSDKNLFLKLIQVNSVGPKLALTILSGIPAKELANAICREDLVQLTAIPGIGKKTAERLIVDLKDKILDLVSMEAQEKGSGSSFTPSSLSEEAISALMNLGYSRGEALNALKAIPQEEELSLEALVREGLKAIS